MHQQPLAHKDGRCYNVSIIVVHCHNTPPLKNVLDMKSYVSGYVDGEGCFSVSFSRREKLLVGWETKPSFSVSQNADRGEVLFHMQTYFGCGFIRRDFSDKTIKYEIRSLDELLSKIIPHFENYPLFSSKQNDFLLFKEVCHLMKNGEHKNPNGLKRIMELAFQMNPSGKRKYSQKNIIESISSDEDIVSASSNRGIKNT